MAIQDGTFSYPYPVLGTPFKDQLTTLRNNSVEISAAALASVIDVDGSNNLNRALAGLYFGEFGFKNKVRLFYDKATDVYSVAVNTGTSVSPVWANAFTIDSLGRLTGLTFHSSVFGSPVSVGTANAVGSSGLFSQSDHVHADRVMNSTNVQTLNPMALSVTTDVVHVEMAGIPIPGADGIKDYDLSLFFPFQIAGANSGQAVRIRLGTAGTIADPILLSGPLVNMTTTQQGYPYSMGPYRLNNPPVNSKITVSVVTTGAGSVTNTVTSDAILNIMEI
jgi:hypothetical protein